MRSRLAVVRIEGARPRAHAARTSIRSALVRVPAVIARVDAAPIRVCAVFARAHRVLTRFLRAQVDLPAIHVLVHGTCFRIHAVHIAIYSARL